MITKDQLKADIKAKFVTQTNFAKRAKRSRYEFLQKVFALKSPSQKQLLEIKQVLDRTPAPVYKARNEFTARMRSNMRNRILTDYGSVYAFCKKNPEYLTYIVYNILNGKYKRMTKNIKKLVAFLNL